MNNNLTRGAPFSVLWRFCLPLFGSVVFQQLYNIADSFAAGRFIGEEALAAVGNSYEITLIFIAIAFGANIGASVIVAQLFGSGRYSELKGSVYTIFLFILGLCALLVPSGFLLSDTLLSLINTPSNIFSDSKIYLNIYIAGVPFMFFYNVSTGVFSALGDSKTPFIFLAASSSANILADILFVTAFDMGVAGVAWATFICQGVSCVLALACIMRRVSRLNGRRSCIFSTRILSRFLSVALPSMLQQSSISIGNIVIQGVVNTFGSAVIAGFSAATKLNTFAISALTSVGNAMSNFTGQNIGADKPERVRRGLLASFKIVGIISVPFILAYISLGGFFTHLLISNASEEAVRASSLFLRIVAPFYIVIGIKLASDGILRGTRRMNRFMTATVLDLLMRVILAITLSPRLGVVGIYISWPIGWSVALILSLTFTLTSGIFRGKTEPISASEN